MKPGLSVVVPVYGSEGTLHELHRRLVATLEPVADFELILVDEDTPEPAGRVLYQLP